MNSKLFLAFLILSCASHCEHRVFTLKVTRSFADFSIRAVVAGGTSFAPWEGPCRPFVKSQQPVLFNDYLSNGESIKDILPNSGSCFSYKLPVITYPTSPCSLSSNGTLTLELWLTDANNNPLDPRVYMPGIHLIAARSSSTSSGYPSVTSIFDGSAIYKPAYMPNISSVYSLNYAQIDQSSITHDRTSQRIVIPIGAAFDFSSGAGATENWSISIANMNSQPAWGSSVYFSIRATCLATQPPCPKSGPYQSPCSGNGACSLTQSPQPTCTCNSSFGGSSCGYPYVDLTSSSGTPALIQVPGQAWAYFTVNVPDSQFPSDLTTVVANILAELTLPGGSLPTYQTVLVMSPRGQSADSPQFDPPSLVDPNMYSQTAIDSMYFNYNSQCTSGPQCSLPYQGLNYKYSLQRLSPYGPRSWWIGVFNNAAWSSNTSTLNMSLKARWTVSNALNSASPLCPLDCSGHGSCSAPAAYASSSMQPLFVCNCNSQYGGPYCQGQRVSPTISSTYSFYDTNPVMLPPGGSQFFMVSGLNGVNGGSQPNFFVSFSTTSLSGIQPATLIFAPYVSNSVGNLFFRPDLSYVITSSGSFTIPTNKNVDTWIFGVYNSNISIVSSATYELQVFYPSGSTPASADPSMLQLIIIGGVSGFILILLVFMAIKLLLMRRYIIQRQEIIMIQQQILAAQERRRGVPQDIIATFPTFEFDPDEFKREMALRQEEKNQKLASEDSSAKAGEAAKDTRGVRSKPSTSTGHSSPIMSNAVETNRGETNGDEDVVDLEAGENATEEENGVKTDTSRSDGDDKEEVFSDVEAEDPVRNEDQEGFELPQCSICIGDFEEGEVLRRLPCHHLFHQSCIDQWMKTHTTCPNCRRGLCPRPTTARPARRGRQTNANQVQPATAAVATAEQPRVRAQGTRSRQDERLISVIRSLTSIINGPGSRTEGADVELQVIPSPSPLAAVAPETAQSVSTHLARVAPETAPNGIGSTTEATAQRPVLAVSRPDRSSPILSAEESDQPGDHSQAVRGEASRAVAESITPRSLTSSRESLPHQRATGFESSSESWQLPGSPDR